MDNDKQHGTSFKQACGAGQVRGHGAGGRGGRGERVRAGTAREEHAGRRRGGPGPGRARKRPRLCAASSRARTTARWPLGAAGTPAATGAAQCAGGAGDVCVGCTGWCVARAACCGGCRPGGPACAAGGLTGQLSLRVGRSRRRGASVRPRCALAASVRLLLGSVLRRARGQRAGICCCRGSVCCCGRQQQTGPPPQQTRPARAHSKPGDGAQA